jgi:hypothetical protein
MKLRRFNRDGVEAFIGYRSRLALEPTLQPPLELLEDTSLTEVLPIDVDVPETKFSNRLAAGRFLNDLLNSAKIDLPERDQGLWTWLTLFYFDEVCPPNGRGERDTKDDEARLVPKLDNHQRFYRHLLVGPFLIVRAHRDNPERAIAMLCNPVWQPGEIAEQLASRKELVTNRGVAEAATFLYYDTTTGSFKRGAGAKVKGAPRRLATLLDQLDLTYYLYGMNAAEMLALLPKEFDRFRTASA